MPPPKDPAKLAAYKERQSADQRGRKRSPESIAKTAAANRIRWQDAGRKEEQSRRSKEYWSDPDRRAEQTAKQKEASNRPERVEHMRQVTKKRYEDPEAHRVQSDMAKDRGFGKWNKGAGWRRNPGVRASIEAKAWTVAVLERDNHTCQDCGCTDDIVTHHIKEWKDHVELRFDVSNGVTLCRSCHGKRHYPKGKPVAIRNRST